jgi:hypothetical protein
VQERRHASTNLIYSALQGGFHDTISSKSERLSWRRRCIRPIAVEQNLSGTSVDERRDAVKGDRRRHSRNGRRAADPRKNWRRLAWLFALYAAYLSVRSLPATIRQLWPRQPS